MGNVSAFRPRAETTVECVLTSTLQAPLHEKLSCYCGEHSHVASGLGRTLENHCHLTQSTSTSSNVMWNYVKPYIKSVHKKDHSDCVQHMLMVPLIQRHKQNFQKDIISWVSSGYYMWICLKHTEHVCLTWLPALQICLLLKMCGAS